MKVTQKSIFYFRKHCLQQKMLYSRQVNVNIGFLHVSLEWLFVFQQASKRCHFINKIRLQAGLFGAFEAFLVATSNLWAALEIIHVHRGCRISTFFSVYFHSIDSKGGEERNFMLGCAKSDLICSALGIYDLLRSFFVLNHSMIYWDLSIKSLYFQK